MFGFKVCYRGQERVNSWRFFYSGFVMLLILCFHCLCNCMRVYPSGVAMVTFVGIVLIEADIVLGP